MFVCVCVPFFKLLHQLAKWFLAAAAAAVLNGRLISESNSAVAVAADRSCPSICLFAAPVFAFSCVLLITLSF